MPAPLPNLRRLRFLIENDLARDDMANIIPREIELRVEHYQNEFFYPGPQTITVDDAGAPLTTFPNVLFYQIPFTLLTLSCVRMTYGGSWVELYRESIETLLQMDVNIPEVLSPPTNYAVQANRVRLYPCPGDIYPLEFTGQGRIPAPVDDEDINFWTYEAALLIRHSVTAEIRRSKIGDLERAAISEAAAERERLRLQGITSATESTGVVKGYLYP